MVLKSLKFNLTKPDVFVNLLVAAPVVTCESDRLRVFCLFILLRSGE